MRTRALPERNRLAYNLAAGYEVRFTHPDSDETKWVPIIRVLHIDAPLRVTVLFFDAPVWPQDNDEGRVSCDPRDVVMSRRPAEETP